ncbi:MAG TPA: hypothetical protein VIN58_09840 [Roseateles sp.]
MTILRPLLLTTGFAAAAAFVLRTRRGNDPRPAALPRADGPLPAAGDEVDPEGLAEDLPARALEAGMPADMHADAHRARPGFADYSRGA